MATDSDHDSLFGDCDTDSLFGGDYDDSPSLFTEDTGESPATEFEVPSLPMSSQPSGGELSLPKNMQLSLPTSVQLTLPTSVQPPEPTDMQLTLPVTAPEPCQTVCTGGLTLPTVPDPLDALLCVPDGHTSGSPAVSTQNLLDSIDFSSFQALEEDDELDAMLEWEMLKDQAVNAHAGMRGSQGDQGGLGIPLARVVPEFRWVHQRSYRGICLPRRVDLEESHIEAILPYLNLKSDGKLADLYIRLELDARGGKKLSKDFKEYFESTSFATISGYGLGLSAHETKTRLAKTAFHLLKTQGWGDKWFGRLSATAKTRTRFWPRDSTEIMFNFIYLLHRAIRVRKQCEINSGRKTRNIAQNTPTLQMVSSLTGAVGSVGASPVPSPAPSPPIPVESLVQSVNSIKKQKQDAKNKQNNGINNKNNNADATIFVLDIPADAQLTYNVFVKDKQDGSDLAPRATYRHTDDVIARGAFAYFKSSFEAAGYTPVFWVLTPFGSKCVASEAEWDQAILGVYNWRRSGGEVEVDVLV